MASPRLRWVVVAVASALSSTTCGASVGASADGTASPLPTSTTSMPGEPEEPVPDDTVPFGTTVAPTTTVASSPPTSRGIPLAEARAAGLWGRPSFAGCMSVHGTPSPPWFDGELLAAAGWPSSQWDAVCRVVGCESNFLPDRVGGLGDRMVGLLQLDRRSWGQLAASMGYGLDDLRTPHANLHVGRALFERLADANGSGEAWLPSSRGGWDCAWVTR